MENCETCKKIQSAPKSVPYSMHELSIASAERQIKRLWIAVTVLIFLLVGTNASWLWWSN